MKKLCLSTVTVIACLSASTIAQEQVRPNFMNEQQSEQLYNQTIAASAPKLVKAQADLVRKQYEALISSGFSKSEALQIVIAMASRDKQ